MLAGKYPCDINGTELFSGYKDILILILLKRALKILNYTPKGLLEYICLTGLEQFYNFVKLYLYLLHQVNNQLTSLN